MKKLALTSTLALALFHAGQVESPANKAYRNRIRPEVLDTNSRAQAALLTGLVPDIKAASKEKIKTARPGISEETLACDEKVINEVLPKITSNFKENGFSAEDAVDATFEGWEAVRLTSPLQPDRCMAPTSFQKYATSLGKLVFQTTPDRASIRVNGIPLNRETRFRRWYEPKTYQVTYLKDGYSPFEKACTVVTAEETICDAQLTTSP